MPCNNSTTDSKKYWEDMDDNGGASSTWAPSFGAAVTGVDATSDADKEKAEEEKDMDDNGGASSWVPSFFGAAVTGVGATADADEEKADEEHDAPPEVNKPDIIKRASTVSTILDSEHFDSSPDLYHDGEQGWEVTLSKRRFLDKYTRHPHFCRRLSICSVISILGIVLVAVLCATLTGESVSTTANKVSNGASGNDIDTNGSASDGHLQPGTSPGNDISETSSSSTIDLTTPASPFSTLDPVEDLGVMGVVHSVVPPESLARVSDNKAMPTNAWYENLIVGAKEEPPTNIYKAYAVPYLVDAAGAIPGLRVHPNHLDTQDSLVQLLVVEPHGLTLGASGSTEMAYNIASTNPLGVTLEWVRCVVVWCVDGRPLIASVASDPSYSLTHALLTTLRRMHLE